MSTRHIQRAVQELYGVSVSPELIAKVTDAVLEEYEDSALGERYPDVVRSWRSAWSRVVPYFAFSASIRKAIYTTNAIESLNGVIRRAVKLRGHFTSPRSARKRIYLVSGRKPLISSL